MSDKPYSVYVSVCFTGEQLLTLLKEADIIDNSIERIDIFPLSGNGVKVTYEES